MATPKPATLETVENFTAKNNRKNGKEYLSGIMQSNGLKFATDGCTLWTVRNDAPDQDRPDGGQPPQIGYILKDREKVQTRATINTADLLQAVKGAAVFAREGSAAVYLRSQGDALYIVANSYETGSSCRKLIATWRGLIEINHAVNYTYLEKLCQFLKDAPEITLEFISASGPVFIGHDDRLVVIMPMRGELDAAEIIERSKAPRPEPRPWAEIKDTVYLFPPRGSEHYEMETIETATRWPCYQYQADYTAEPVRITPTSIPRSEPAPGMREFIIADLDVYSVPIDDERIHAEIALIPA